MSHACVIHIVDVLVAMFVLCSHLERCRARLSATCQWLGSVTMELYVKCQLCEPCPDKCRDGTNICILHKVEGCFHFDCGHYIPLRSFGLTCEHSVDAVPDFPAEKLDPWAQVRKKKQFNLRAVNQEKLKLTVGRQLCRTQHFRKIFDSYQNLDLSRLYLLQILQKFFYMPCSFSH